jgi:hypothetical protein
MAIKTQTQAVQPTNRDRKNIGVGEKVNLEILNADDYVGTVVWSLVPAGSGEIESDGSDPFNKVYLAPDVKIESVAIKAVLDDGRSAQVVLKVIAPNGLKFVAEGREDGGIRQNKEIGMQLHPAFYLLPDTVNFQNLKTYEGEAIPERTGYFLQNQYPSHPSNGPHANPKYDNQYGNRGNGTNETLDYDMFQAATEGPPYAQSGTIKWTCDWEYQVFRDGSFVGQKHKFTTATMSLEIVNSAETVKAIISKGEAFFDMIFDKDDL